MAELVPLLYGLSRVAFSHYFHRRLSDDQNDFSFSVAGGLHDVCFFWNFSTSNTTRGYGVTGPLHVPNHWSQVGGFWDAVFNDDFGHYIPLNMYHLARCNQAAAAVLISAGAVLGKASIFQMACMCIWCVGGPGETLSSCPPPSGRLYFSG